MFFDYLVCSIKEAMGEKKFTLLRSGYTFKVV